MAYFTILLSLLVSENQTTRMMQCLSYKIEVILSKSLLLKNAKAIQSDPFSLLTATEIIQPFRPKQAF